MNLKTNINKIHSDLTSRFLSASIPGPLIFEKNRFDFDYLEKIK